MSAHRGTPIRSILIANRGEIARRVARTAREMGLRVIAVYADSDAAMPFVREADVAVALDGDGAADTYLDVEKILAAAARTDADAIHPGYGFLSENAEFAQAVLDAGRIWIGPSPAAMRAMARKIEAKELAAAAGVPVLPSVRWNGDLDAAAGIGYPLLVKASAGGGGRGMRLVHDVAQLAEAIASAQRESESAFGDGTLFLERAVVSGARHIEIQILGDEHGQVVHLFERECSIQRRHQKVIEESPSTAVTPVLRERMCAAATSLARSIGYTNAGTVELLVEGTGDDASFWFLEMNTRLQVEHPVTEAVTSLDLVRLQIDIANGKPLPFAQADIVAAGHAIEVRLYAEDPSRGWLPSTGTIARFRAGPTTGIRLDAGVETGSIVGPQFDPMLAKVIAHAGSRGEAAARLARALMEMQIHGVHTNRDFLVEILRDDDFRRGDLDTAYLDRHSDLLSPSPSATTTAAHRAAAVAALVQTIEPPIAAVPLGWRNVVSQPATMQLLDRDGATTDCVWCVDRLNNGVVVRDAAGGGETRVDGGRVMIDGITIACDTSVDGPMVWVDSNEAHTVWTRAPRYVDRAIDATAGRAVAPVPGKVVAVLVSPGESVVAGQTLVVLEAMKVEHQITAPGPAIVESVLVDVGQSVDAQTVLVALATPPTS